ncbi:hypothetical protein V8G54_009893 [Vigna mungo]|uniref:Uncharacterized protein n=1 Tax=Vigna mungo TaxID=3915 RepID=A0AAQ3NXJ6_VIGMU
MICILSGGNDLMATVWRWHDSGARGDSWQCDWSKEDAKSTAQMQYSLFAASSAVKVRRNTTMAQGLKRILEVLRLRNFFLEISSRCSGPREEFGPIRHTPLTGQSRVMGYSSSPAACASKDPATNTPEASWPKMQYENFGNERNPRFIPINPEKENMSVARFHSMDIVRIFNLSDEICKRILRSPISDLLSPKESSEQILQHNFCNVEGQSNDQISASASMVEISHSSENGISDIGTDNTEPVIRKERGRRKKSLTFFTIDMVKLDGINGKNERINSRIGNLELSHPKVAYKECRRCFEVSICQKITLRVALAMDSSIVGRSAVDPNAQRWAIFFSPLSVPLKPQTMVSFSRLTLSAGNGAERWT